MGSHGELANEYYSPFALQGRIWGTVDHFFHAMKFAGANGGTANSAAGGGGGDSGHRDLVDEVWLAPQARDAFELARHHQANVRPDWAHVKEKVLCIHQQGRQRVDIDL